MYLNRYLKITFHLLSMLTYFVPCKFSTIDDIQNVFGSKSCVEGSFSMISLKYTETELYVNKVNDSANTSANYKFEKPAMMKLHELAQYNQIKYFYKLEKEEGPPHNKLFTVSVRLGDEEFVSEGTTLKKAQHNAANVALENTSYELPPFKELEQNQDALTPTVLLNNLGSKFGIKIEYYLVDKDRVLNTNVDGRLKKSYLEKLNESVYLDSEIHVKKDETQSKGPYKVMVEVGDVTFYGISYTIQSARHEAATKGVDYIIKQIQEGNLACIKEDSKECKQAKTEIKSPISLVYEAANLRNIDVEFDIIKEEGPPHKKIFVTQCRLANLITTGEGKSKKESKKAAALNMLDKMSELPKIPQHVLANSLLKDKNKKNGKKNKKNKVIKNQFDMINMHVDNLIESVLDSMPISSSNKKNPGHIKYDTSNISKQKPSKKPYQDEILDLSNLLNIEVQFMDVDNKDEYFSILSLHINPHYICLGKGVSTRSARNQASQRGLKLLQTIPFNSYLSNKKYTALESEIKERINSLLRQEISEEK